MSSYIAIASQTLSSPSTTVQFNSIPTLLQGKTLRDLVLICSLSSGGIANVVLRFNGDTGTNYSRVTMQGTSGATASFNATEEWAFVSSNNAWANRTISSLVVDIFDFSQNNKHKSLISRWGNPSLGVSATAGRWASASVINSVEVRTSNTDGFSTGSLFTLYGIEG